MIIDNNPDLELMKADGFDDAIIGVSEGIEEPRLIYSIQKAVEILMERDGMEWYEANEYLAFNAINVYMGEKTPIWVNEVKE